MEMRSRSLPQFVSIVLTTLTLIACNAQVTTALPLTPSVNTQTGATLTNLPPTQVAAIPTSPAPTEVPSLAASDLENATYQAGDFTQMSGGKTSFALVNGSYSQSDPAFNLKFMQSAGGDLNGDGLPDAAAILAADTSGSGTFVYLAALINQAGTLSNIDTVLLGDRILVQTIAIQDGKINLHMLIQGPKDPQCCPSTQKNETYFLDSQKQVTPDQKAVAPLAEAVIQALKAKDMNTLVGYVSPASGLRFSPYANVKTTDQVFTQTQLKSALASSPIYDWGSYDGSGKPIQLSFADYYASFVYSKDFAGTTQIGYNRALSSGNTIDNSHDFYANAYVIEYYLPGSDVSSGGMDWQSLRLVFQPENGQWMLTGIIHSQWTI